MATQLKTKIQLRMDSVANFNEVGDSFKPLAGEVCLVKTDVGLRAKVGDGSRVWKDLAYADQNNPIVVIGYYHNGDFYKDSTYTEAAKLERCDRHVYIDKNSSCKKLFVYDSSKSQYISISADEASETIPGVMKLYKTHGEHEDGTMTQKSITTGVNNIKFATDDDCLVLNPAW